MRSKSLIKLDKAIIIRVAYTTMHQKTRIWNFTVEFVFIRIYFRYISDPVEKKKKKKNFNLNWIEERASRCRFFLRWLPQHIERLWYNLLQQKGAKEGTMYIRIEKRKNLKEKNEYGTERNNHNFFLILIFCCCCCIF